MLKLAIAILSFLLISAATAAATPQRPQNPIWNKTLPNINSMQGPAGMIAVGNTIVLATMEGVYGVDARSGTVLYGPLHQGLSYVSNVPILTTCNGIDYVLLNNGSLICIDPHNGAFLWSSTYGNEPYGIAADGCVAVWAGNYPTRVSSYNVTNGHVIAQSSNIWNVQQSATYAIAAGRYYIGVVYNGLKNITALDVYTMQEHVWTSVDWGSGAIVTSPPAEEKKCTTTDAVYVVGAFEESGKPNVVGALEVTTGKIIWSKPLALSDFTPPVFVGKTTFCTSGIPFVGENTTVVCFDRTDGSMVNLGTLDGQVSGMAASTQNTNIFVAEEANTPKPYAYNLFSTELGQKTNFSFVDGITLSPVDEGTETAQTFNVVVVEGTRWVIFGTWDSPAGTYTLSAYLPFN